MLITKNLIYRIKIKIYIKINRKKKICTYIPLESELDINLFLNTFLEIQTTFLDDNELNVCL